TSYFSRHFWNNSCNKASMMVCFPIHGYGAVSITFSTLHILASYLFMYLVWKDHVTRHSETSLMIKTALVLMAMSTIGVWSLGPLAITGGRSSTLYQLAIQFYLHFQFHGWFSFAILALLLYMLTRNSGIHHATFRKFYALLLASVVLTYGLVLTWGFGGSIPLVINGIGLLLQLTAMILYLRLLKDADQKFFQNLPPSVGAFYRFGLISWIAKVSIQTVVLLPAAA